MIYLPCSSKFYFENIEFSSATLKTTAVRACSGNFYEYDVANIVYSNFEGKFIAIATLTIIYDGDGSFTNNTAGAPLTVVGNYAHLRDEEHCPNPSAERWPSTLVCDRNSVVRILRFSANFERSWWGPRMYVNRIVDFSDKTNSYLQTYSDRTLYIPFITGRYYKFWYSTDFLNVYISPTERVSDEDEPILFKHMYSKSRELYEVKTIENGRYSDPQTNQQIVEDFDLETCQLGDFYHDNDNRTFGVCWNTQANWTAGEYIHAKGIFCRDFCPEPEEGNNGGGEGGCSYQL